MTKKTSKHVAVGSKDGKIDKAGVGKKSKVAARADTIPDRHRTLGALLRGAYDRMAVWLYGELAARGFTEVRVAHSAVFRAIAADGSRVVDLAARAGMTKQSMAYLVEQLEGFGYLDIVPDPDDGRAKLVTLTRRGKALHAAAVELSAQAERRMGGLLGEERMSLLRDALEQVYDDWDPADTPQS